jgi:hypothetical protein
MAHLVQDLVHDGPFGVDHLGEPVPDPRPESLDGFALAFDRVALDDEELEPGAELDSALDQPKAVPGLSRPFGGVA